MIEKCEAECFIKMFSERACNFGVIKITIREYDSSYND